MGGPSALPGRGAGCQLDGLTRNPCAESQEEAGLAGNLKGGGGGVGFGPRWRSPGAVGRSMADDAGAAEAQGDQWTPAPSMDRMLRSPPPPPRIRTRPWWFPVQELRDPLVFYLEAWLADSIFGEPP